MARGPETRPPLGVKAKDNIGNFYLSNLLKSKNAEKVYYQNHVSDLVRLQLTDLAGIQIPQPFADQLEFDDLNWSIPIANPNIYYGLPVLFAGKKDLSYQNITRGNIQEADVTIEIARKKDVSAEKQSPFYVRIAGVVEDRVVAATYDLSNKNQLTALTISLSKNEASELLTDSKPLLTTNINNPYETAALITSAMCERTDHDRAITFKVDNGLVKVQPEIAGPLDMFLWKINIPASLQPISTEE